MLTRALAPAPPVGTVARLPCGHEFHAGCIRKWLWATPEATCPLCKASPLLASAVATAAPIQVVPGAEVAAAVGSADSSVPAAALPDELESVA